MSEEFILQSYHLWTRVRVGSGGLGGLVVVDAAIAGRVEDGAMSTMQVMVACISVFEQSVWCSDFKQEGMEG